jgi:hypothetical protein
MGMTCTVFGDGAVFRGEEGESENDTLGPAPGNNIPLGIQAVVNVSVTLANANFQTVTFDEAIIEYMVAPGSSLPGGAIGSGG